jgi:ribosome-associated toxin RatA of RatAB toxin-antitoxin module
MINKIWAKRILASLLFIICCGTTGDLPAMAGHEYTRPCDTPHSPSKPEKSIQTRLLIEAPPQLVWQTLTNYADIKNVLPGYEKSTVLKASGSLKTVDIRMKVSAFLPAYHYQVQMKEDVPSLSLYIRRISGDFKSLNANYKLVSQNNGTRTLLVYNLNLDTGMNLPGTQAIIRSNTEKSMKALETHILQEARKSLIGQR